MTTTTERPLLEAVRTLEPLIAAHADDAERARRISKVVLDAMAEAGLYRLLSPAVLGGLETDPVTAASVIEEVSRIDSTAGWSLMTGNSVDWWLCRLPAEGAEEIYAEDPTVIIAAAFHPPMQAVEVDGGYVVTGRSPFASNIHDSTWTYVTALVMDGDDPRLVDGAPVAIVAIARTSEVEILDTWYTLGMRGTDSNDVKLDGVFVPAWRTHPLAPAFVPGPAYLSPLYRIPGMAAVAVIGPPVLLGIARRGLDAAWSLAAAKTPFGALSKLAERGTAQRSLARAEATLRAGRSLLYGTLAEVWEQTQAGHEFGLGERAEMLLASAQAVAASAEAIELAFGVAGTTAIYEGNALERAFRDVQTLRHHGFMSEARFEAFAQVRLGLEPEFGMVAF